MNKAAFVDFPSLTFFLLLLVIICSFAPNAGAYRGGGGTKVLIARDVKMSGFEYRIKAELEATGFTVLLFDMDFREDTRRIMSIEAHTHNAAAAIVCRRASGFVEIWISDKVTNKDVLRRVAIPDHEDADAFVALSTVELLRASLLEVHTAAKLTGSVAPTDVIRKLVSPNTAAEPSLERMKQNQQDKFSIQINPALLVLRFQGNPMLNIQLSGSYRLHRALDLKIHGQSPILPHRVRHPDGDILVRTGFIATGLNLTLVYPKHIASGDIGAGFMLLIHRATGQPVAGNTGYEQTFVTGAPYLAFGIDLQMAEKLRIRLETIGGWSLSKLALKINDNKVAEMGNFFISVGLGLMFTL